MSGFQVVLLEGVVQVSPEECRVTREGKYQDLHVALAPLVGSNVQMAAHHLPHPPTPRDPSKWLNIVSGGLLSREDDFTYSVRKLDGTVDRLDLRLFHGCMARFAAASLDTVDQMRDRVVASGAASTVEGLGQQAEELRNLMDNLTRITKGQS